MEEGAGRNALIAGVILAGTVGFFYSAAMYFVFAHVKESRQRRPEVERSPERHPRGIEPRGEPVNVLAVVLIMGGLSGTAELI
jgi:hypothetical protein